MGEHDVVLSSRLSLIYGSHRMRVMYIYGVRQNKIELEPVATEVITRAGAASQSFQFAALEHRALWHQLG